MTTTTNLETTLKEFLVRFNGLTLKPKKDYFTKFNNSTLNDFDYLDIEEFKNCLVICKETDSYIFFTLEEPLSDEVNKLFQHFECIDVKKREL